MLIQLFSGLLAPCNGVPRRGSGAAQEAQLCHTQGCVEADTLQIKPEVLHVLQGVEDVAAALEGAAALRQVVMQVTDGGVHNHSIPLHVHKHLPHTAQPRL